MHKLIRLTLLLIAIFFRAESSYAQQVYSPVDITKSATNNVYVHLMPWFESMDYSGYWGQHWTMDTEDPDTYNDEGERNIASYYYPLIGPYASGDPDLIEYQLLLMKLSGIDGVLIDWPGSYDAYDYAANLANAEAFIDKIPETGLEFAIVYEDHNLALSGVSDQVATAQNDMNYAQTNYFSNDQYIYIDDKPLLLDFGPQTIVSESDWTTAFANLSPKPYFLTLWYEHDDAGSNCSGEFAWVYQDDTPYLTHLSSFYLYATNYGLKMGAACPGFNTFYEEGGWGSSDFTIDHNDLSTFQETFDLALENNMEYIQIATWNDYGEGTMIEPTVEFGYGFLTYIQESLGVEDLGEDELKLVTELYNQRKEYADDSDEQARLDQVFYYLVSLQISEAEELLTGTTSDSDESTDGISGLGGTYYLENYKSGLVMDVYYGGTDDGVNILQYINGGTANQQFTLVEVSTGVYYIMNVNSGKVVEVTDGSTDNNANIQQGTYSGADYQLFTAESTIDGYYKFKALHSDKIIEVVNGSTEENANISQFTDNDQICGQWALVSVSDESSWSATVEAEDFTYYSGIITESCDEGGYNVGSIETGDWMLYTDIEIPYSGTYTVNCRVASESNGGQLNFNHTAGTIILDYIDIPVTGSWQTWTTVSGSATLDAGSYDFGIYAQEGGWNINWFSLSYSGTKSTKSESVSSLNETELKIYPNPVNDMIFISGLDNKCSIQIINLQGKIVQSAHLENGAEGIDVSQLNTGVFILKVMTEETTKTLRFIR